MNHLVVRDGKWNWPDYGHFCFRCKRDMRGSAYGDTSARREDLDNELILIFAGGYGSFIDSHRGEFPTIAVCHECAHELCLWLGVDPSGWHTHSILGGQHPDHDKELGDAQTT